MIVLDALVLKLKSSDPVDIAVCLLCGRWRTRMWTYQEARLAFSTKILTGLGAVDAYKINTSLEEKIILLKEQLQQPESAPVLQEEGVRRILEQMKAIFRLGKTTLTDV